MPYAIHEGDRIHYQVFGAENTANPPLIIQHGLFSSGTDLAYPQFVEAVSGTFRMIFPDSLGHGDSDKPDDPARYTLAHRAGDISAILDAEGIDKAHYFGYSMGGWIGTAMAKHAPERLLSLCIAGWPIDRTPPEAFKDMGADEIWASVKRMLFFSNSREFSRLNEKTEPAVRHCFEAVRQNEGTFEAVRDLDVPRMMACGEDDDMYADAERVAAELDIPFLPVPGDHGAAINENFGFWFPRVADFFLGEVDF